jgi:hypothetical protein
LALRRGVGLRDIRIQLIRNASGCFILFAHAANGIPLLDQ